MASPAVPHARRMEQLRESIDAVRAAGTSPDRVYALLDAVVAVTTDLDLRRLLHRIVTAGCELTGARFAGLGVLDESGQRFAEFLTDCGTHERSSTSCDPHGTEGLETRLPLGGPFRLDDPSCLPWAAGCPALHAGMQNFLGVPIHVQDSVFGTLLVADKADAEQFTTQDESILVALSAAAGVAIGNARILSASAARQRWMEAAAEITGLLLAEQADSGTALKLLTRRVREMLEADLVVLCLRADRPNTVRVEVADGVGASVLVGSLLPETTLCSRVYASGQTIVVEDFTDDDRFLPPKIWGDLPVLGPAVGVPLASAEQVYGVLGVFSLRDSRDPFTDFEAQLVEAFAGQAALALDRIKAQEERRMLAVLEERDRIARDLHDVVIQRLFGAGLKLQRAARLTTKPEVEKRIDDTIDDLDATIQDIRGLILQLHRPHNSVDLRTRMSAIVGEVSPALGFTPSLVVDGPVEDSLDAGAGTDVLAVMREALSNVARHASAKAVEVRLQAGTEIVLQVIDDGVGSNVVEGVGTGLRTMRERAERRGGSLTVSRRPLGGTRIEWRVPASRSPSHSAELLTALGGQQL